MSKSSPHYFGDALVDGVWKFIRRWTATGPIEVISPEELRREHEENVARREAVKAAVLKRNPRATPQEIVEAMVADEKRCAASEGPAPTPEEIAAGDEEFEMSRRIADWKKVNRR